MSFKLTKLYGVLESHDAFTPSKVRALIEKGENVQLTDPDTGRGYVHQIVELLEGQRSDKESAAACHLIPSLAALAHAGAAVNLQDADGNTPLHLAFIVDGGPRVVDLLLKLGADVNLLNDSRQKVTDLVTENSDPVMVKILGAMCPSLYQAVEANDYDHVVEMLGKWGKIDSLVDGKSLIEAAKQVCSNDIIKVLQNKWPTNQFIYAALTGDTKKMRKIMKREKIDFNVKTDCYIDEEGNSVDLPLLGVCLALELYEVVELLLESGADPNRAVKVTDAETGTSSDEPLYFYLMKRSSSLVFKEIFPKLLNAIDLSLVVKYSVGVLYTGYSQNWPDAVVDHLMQKGLDITRRSEEGYTLRDNIFVQVAFYPRRKRLLKLNYVDRYVIGLATKGDVEQLRKLALRGYTNLNVFDTKAKSASYLARKAGHQEAADFLEVAGEYSRSIHSLHKYIEGANLLKAKEILSDNTAFANDRAGRSPLHKAVLYERRFVIKHLLKEYPALVNAKDDFGRTPLHYACALHSGQDIEDMLMKSGANEAMQDDLGRTAMDYKIRTDENFLEGERKKNGAMNIYFLEVYINIADGIIEDDFDLVRDTRDELFEDVKLDQVTEQMFKPAGDTPPSFLQLCIDYKRENIARFLLNSGLSDSTRVEYQKVAMPFAEAADKCGMARLKEFIARKRLENGEDDELRFKKAEEAIRGGGGNGGGGGGGGAGGSVIVANGKESRDAKATDERSSGSSGADEDGQKEHPSKSCVLL